MRRAAQLFAFERASSRSALVHSTWSTCSANEGSFLSVAVCHWEMVVTRQAGRAWLTIRGPETRATVAPVPGDAEFFGIVFRHGAFMPDFAPRALVDRSVDLPATEGGAFWLDGSTWELPGPDNADVFVSRLVRAGLLVHDPIAAAAVRDDVTDVGNLAAVGRRTLERRVVRATGLTRGTIRQIRRAQVAVDLLASGVPTLDVVHRAGYADQAHLTRSLRRFVGLTPSRVAAGA